MDEMEREDICMAAVRTAAVGFFITFCFELLRLVFEEAGAWGTVNTIYKTITGTLYLISVCIAAFAGKGPIVAMTLLVLICTGIFAILADCTVILLAAAIVLCILFVHFPSMFFILFFFI